MNKRKILWAIISLCIAVGSILMVARQSKTFRPEFLLSNIRNMDKRWLCLALVCMFGFIWFEGLAIVRIAKSFGVVRSVRQGIVYGAADVYVSAITPSASGGQPASAYFMMKDGMSASEVAITLLFNLIMYSLALVSIGILTFIFWGKILFRQSIQFRVLFGIGFFVMIGLAVIFYMLMKKAQIMYHICDKILIFLERIKIVKNIDAKRKKLKTAMKQYQECARIISDDKKLLIDAYLLNVLQRFSQLGVTFCVFMACGKGLALSLYAMVTQCFVAVGSNCVPIPGAMGVADYMMLGGFAHLVGKANAVHMELLCRGINFYGCVITGSIITVIGYLTRRRKEKNVGVL